MMKVNDTILATYSNGKNYDGRIVSIRKIGDRDMVTVMHYTLQDAVVRYASLYMDKCESVTIIPVD